MSADTMMVQTSSPSEAYDAVNSGNGILVDVRTKAEWTYVGVPQLQNGSPVLIEWQRFPDMSVDAQFGPTLEARCPDRDVPLYFICRSGARSNAAAELMGARGYRTVINVVDGFEGPPDAHGHRGTVAGWKAEGLPWRQS